MPIVRVETVSIAEATENGGEWNIESKYSNSNLDDSGCSNNKCSDNEYRKIKCSNSKYINSKYNNSNDKKNGSPVGGYGIYNIPSFNITTEL